MRVGVTEFKRRLKELKFADEPIVITRHGRMMGIYTSDNAKATQGINDRWADVDAGADSVSRAND